MYVETGGWPHWESCVLPLCSVHAHWRVHKKAGTGTDLGFIDFFFLWIIRKHQPFILSFRVLKEFTFHCVSKTSIEQQYCRLTLNYRIKGVINSSMFLIKRDFMIVFCVYFVIFPYIPPIRFWDKWFWCLCIIVSNAPSRWRIDRFFLLFYFYILKQKHLSTRAPTPEITALHVIHDPRRHECVALSCQSHWALCSTSLNSAVRIYVVLIYVLCFQS